MDQPKASLLTPGVLDGYAKRAFKYGACGALALALHDATGWPIVAITDAHNVEAGKAGGGSALHWTVRHPNGRLIDIDGSHSAEALVNEYAGDADDGEAAAGLPRGSIVMTGTSRRRANRCRSSSRRRSSTRCSSLQRRVRSEDFRTPAATPAFSYLKRRFSSA